MAVEITKTQWRVGTGNSHYYTLGSLNFFICPQCIPVSTLSTEADNHGYHIFYFTNSFSRVARWVGLSRTLHSAIRNGKIICGPASEQLTISKQSLVSTEIQLSHTFLYSIVPSLSRLKFGAKFVDISWIYC